jgi:flagellar protein FliO/FliZ
MDFADFARAIFALALTLGLVGLAAVGLRKFGPDAIARFVPTRKERRLAVVESLILDPSRRLVLVSVDGQERLLLLGDGRFVDAPPAKRHPAKKAPADA